MCHVLVSLNVMSLLCHFKKIIVLTESHKFDTSLFYSNLPKRVWQILNQGVVSLCMFASPLVVLRVKPLFAFLLFLYACVDCALFVLSEGGLKCLPIKQSNLCFAFWKLFWCSSQVLPCFIVSTLMYMLSFVLPHILLCLAAFLVLRICSTN